MGFGNAPGDELSRLIVEWSFSKLPLAVQALAIASIIFFGEIL